MRVFKGFLVEPQHTLNDELWTHQFVNCLEAPQRDNGDQIMPPSITTVTGMMGEIVEVYTVEQWKHIATTVKH